MKIRILLLLVLLSACVQSVAQIVFHDEFDGERLSSQWHGVRHAEDFKVKDGSLSITLRPEPQRAARLEADIPVIRKGTLEFDLTTTPVNGAKGYGFYVELYGIRLFFHSACRDYRSYFPEPEQNRIMGFKIEPVGHQRVGIVETGRKYRYWINFDADDDRVEFGRYPDTDPEALRTEVAVLAGIEFTGGKLAVGDVGYEGGTSECLLDNVVLRKQTGHSDADAVRSEIIIIEGFSPCAAKILMEDNALKAHIRTYSIMPQINIATSNHFAYKKLPSRQNIAKARCIILDDAPAGPDHCLPDAVIKYMADAVMNGTTLVVLGGLFSLNKGEYAGTMLQGILPVEIDDPFAFHRFATPQPIVSNLQLLDFAKDMKVCFMHDLRPQAGRKVLLTAGGKPLLVNGKHEKGNVFAFLGVPIPAPDGDKSIFFLHSDWPKLLKTICLEELK